MEGSFYYKGIPCAQRPCIKEFFQDLILWYAPQVIIEIGTYQGGLTYILHDILQLARLDTVVHTYDINDVPISGLSLTNVVIHKANVFDCVPEIVDLIKLGRTMVLCDGGNKVEEFNLFSKFIKVGDIIMAHDYAPDNNYFVKNLYNQKWNWLEIQDVEIAKAKRDNNLMPYFQAQAQEMAWLCCVKVRCGSDN